MSIEFKDYEDRIVTQDIFSGGQIKFARFMIGTMTVEISAQDVNSANSPSMHNNGQNTGTGAMVKTAGTSQQVALSTSAQLDGQNSSTSSSPTSTIDAIQWTETKQRIVSRNEEAQNKTRVNKEKDYVKTMSGWLMTVATLLMSMAFQSGLNIPGGTWSDTKINSNSSSQSIIQTTTISPAENYKFLIRTPRINSYSSTIPPNTTDIIYICRNIDSTNDTRHTAGEPIIMNIDKIRYYLFLALNVLSFALSMSVIILLLFEKLPEHSLLSIRTLLVCAMSTIALVYVLGCAPKSLYALFILAFMGTCLLLVQIVWGIKDLAQKLWVYVH